MIRRVGDWLFEAFVLALALTLVLLRPSVVKRTIREVLCWEKDDE